MNTGAIAAGVLALGVVIGGLGTYFPVKWRYEARISKIEGDHALLLKAQSDAARVADARARTAEQKLQLFKDDQDAKDTAAAQAATADKRRADDAARSLRDATTRFAATLASERTKSAAAAGQRPDAGDPIGVLADVLGRVDYRAGILATVADQRGDALTSCVARYESVRAQVNAAR